MNNKEKQKIQEILKYRKEIICEQMYTRKYDEVIEIFENLDRDNFNKIVKFLISEKCDYIEDIVKDYLDLFNIAYEDFIKKYNKLNEKYDGDFLNKASEDMNLLEEFYRI